MLLTISTTQQPATDLGYLLHKNPAHVQSFALNFGQAHVFYPEATDEACTAALLLDVDSVALVRNKDNAALDQYVNDRPYVASSFMSVAIADIFGSALNGRCTKRPELVEREMLLRVCVTVIACRAGESLLRRMFEPLGYTVTLTQHMLDDHYPAWGMSHYYTLTVEAVCRVKDLLTHLYVLLPVMDDEKHYYIGDDEVKKLLLRGKGWLETHPEREQIAYRYLRHQQSLARQALARLVLEEEEDDVVEAAEEASTMKSTSALPELNQEKPAYLHQLRLERVLAVLKEHGARSVLDLGCGEGRLLKLLMQERSFERIVGMDVAYRILEKARQRLHLEHTTEKQLARVKIMHGSLTYRDKRLEGYDAAAVVEVIEHLDAPRLRAFERVLFEFAHPGLVVITTPNAEYNVKFATLHAGTFRHSDHRFEWTRQQFQQWATQVAARFGYAVVFEAIGPEDELVGGPSQMAVFNVISDVERR